MADTTWRALVRDAEAHGDGPAWLRAAQALTRAGRHADAGRALLHASLAGADATGTLDALAPPLDAFTLRALGDRFGLGRLSQAAWSASGAHVFASHAGTVTRFDVRTGAWETVVELPGHVTALAVDPSDALLAAGVLQDEAKARLLVVDLATGAQRELGRGHETIRELVVTHDLVVSAERHRARAYARDASPTARSVWSIKGAAALDRGGWGTVLRDTVHAMPGSYDGALERVPLSPDARARRAPLVPPHVSPVGEVRGVAVFGNAFVHLALPAGCRTALVRGLREVDVLVNEREVVARRSLEHLPRLYSLALAPSGRHLALTHRAPSGLERATTATIVDLFGGASRTFDLDARPRDPVWSPSGRRVALPTDQGVLALLEAPSGDEAAPASTPHEHAWVELRSPRQFWRGRVHGCTVEYHHGRLGAAGQRGVVVCDDAHEAARELERRRREKERRGYAAWTP